MFLTIILPFLRYMTFLGGEGAIFTQPGLWPRKLVQKRVIIFLPDWTLSKKAVGHNVGLQSTENPHILIFSRYWTVTQLRKKICGVPPHRLEGGGDEGAAGLAAPSPLLAISDLGTMVVWLWVLLDTTHCQKNLKPMMQLTVCLQNDKPLVAAKIEFFGLRAFGLKDQKKNNECVY